jgi:hypothetical protein
MHKYVVFIYIYITTLLLYVMFSSTCFDISVSSSGILKNFRLSTLHNFLKFRLLNYNFKKIIRLKYIKILLSRRWVMQ